LFKLLPLRRISLRVRFFALWNKRRDLGINREFNIFVVKDFVGGFL
jgi:hypothetical protein